MFFLGQPAKTTDDKPSDKPSDKSSDKSSDKTGKMLLWDMRGKYSQVTPILMGAMLDAVEKWGNPIPKDAQWAYLDSQWQPLIEAVKDPGFLKMLENGNIIECVADSSPEKVAEKTEDWPFPLDLVRDKEGLAQHGAGESGTNMFVGIHTSIHCYDWSPYSSRSKPEWTIEAQEIKHDYKIAGVLGNKSRGHFLQVEEGPYVNFFYMPFGATAMEYQLGSGVKVFLADVSTNPNPDQPMPSFPEMVKMWMDRKEQEFDKAPHKVGEFSSFNLEISPESTNSILGASIHDRTVVAQGAGGRFGVNSQNPLIFEASMVAMVALRSGSHALSDAPYQFYRVVDGELAFCLFAVVSIHGVPLFMGLVDQTSVPGSADY